MAKYNNPDIDSDTARETARYLVRANQGTIRVHKFGDNGKGPGWGVYQGDIYSSSIPPLYVFKTRKAAVAVAKAIATHIVSIGLHPKLLIQRGGSLYRDIEFF